MACGQRVSRPLQLLHPAFVQPEVSLFLKIIGLSTSGHAGSALGRKYGRHNAAEDQFHPHQKIISDIYVQLGNHYQ